MAAGNGHAVDAPRPTGRPAQVVHLIGSFIPCEASGRPVLVQMPGSSQRYLPTFADEDQLRSVLGRAGVEFGMVQRVYHAGELLDSLPEDIAIAHNLRFTSEGKVRFLQVQRDNAAH